MLYIIGLGLGDYKDITVKGLEIIKRCDRIYLESYTSILIGGKDALESFYGKKIIVADRELVEQGSDKILEGARDSEIAFLVVGDPFSATTHTDLVLRARSQDIKIQVIHNASIINAVGCCGLQLYTFGEIVSIPFWTDTWKPDSYFDKILSNYKNKLHTLCLLDIKVKEPTLESLTKKKREYMPPRFMSVCDASSQLLEIIENRSTNGILSEITADNLCIGLARIGFEDQKIVACPLKQMPNIDLGPPLHSLIIVGPVVHPMEMEFLEPFKV